MVREVFWAVELPSDCILPFWPGADLSDNERDMPPSGSPAPVSYAAQSGTPPSVPVDPTADTLVSSTETLLRNIQGLLKVAADNARQQERQISYEKGKGFWKILCSHIIRPRH